MVNLKHRVVRKLAYHHKAIILVAYSCCDRLPQTSWLKTTQIYYVTVLEARRLKFVSVGSSQGVSRADSFWRLERRMCLLGFLASGGTSVPWLMTPSLHVLLPTSHLLSLPCQNSFCSLPTRHLRLHLGPTCIIQNDLPISRSLT